MRQQRSKEQAEQERIRQIATHKKRAIAQMEHAMQAPPETRSANPYRQLEIMVEDCDRILALEGRVPTLDIDASDPETVTAKRLAKQVIKRLRKKKG